MNVAYGWATTSPARKISYNITTTTISVALALTIGSIELLGVLADRAHITTGPISATAAIPLDNVGYAVVGLFAAGWLVALVVWRFGHLQDNWTPPALSQRSPISN